MSLADRIVVMEGGLIAQVSPEAIFNSDPDMLLFAGSNEVMFPGVSIR